VIRFFSATALALVLAAPAAAHELPRSHEPQPYTQDFQPDDLMTRLYILADELMMGREEG
jgi:hypothetical protein